MDKPSAALLLVLGLWLTASFLGAASLGGAESDPLTSATAKHSQVRIEVALEAQDEGHRLRVVLTPTAPGHWHLYAPELPPDTFVGVATAMRLEDNDWLQAAGGWTSPTPLTTVTMEGFDPLPVYEDGPVVIHQPVTYTPPAAGAAPATLRFSYMACSDTTCQPPAMDVSVPLPPPTAGDTAGTQTTPTTDATPTPPVDAAEPTGQLDRAPDDPLQRIDSLVPSTELPPLHAGPAGLDWYAVTEADQVKALRDHAAKQGKRLFLDITGTYCVNCQVNAKSHFPQPLIKGELAQMVRAELDTDLHPLLTSWQQATFGDQSRPFYVVVVDDELETWSSGTLAGYHEEFVAFLKGGEGTHIEIDSWGALILLSLLGGLITLLMPCTYPMIPLTVNFFNKQAQGGRRILGLSLAYGGGIVVFFTALGWLLGAVFGSSPDALGRNPWVNLGITLLFVGLGLSLLGVFVLRLPSGLNNALLGGGNAGYLGALLMGLTFAITAFTCTAPVAGALLAQAGTQGWLRSSIGMAIYGSAIAIPFIFLALSPRLLERLPKSGGWMNEFKIVGGIVEIAAALKFLFSVGVAWGFAHLLTREVVFGAWSLAALLSALFLAGLVRFGAVEDRVRFTPVRIGFILLFAAIGVYMAYGTLGGNLGSIEGWLAGAPRG